LIDRRLHALTALASAAAFGLPLRAPLGAQTTYFGAGARAAFTAAAVTPVTNNLDAGGLTYSFGALGTGTVVAIRGGTATGTSISAAGLGTEAPAYSTVFSGRLGAFGADFTSLGDFGTVPFPAGSAQFRFFDGTTNVGTFLQNFGGSGATTFLGVAGLQAFDRVEVYANISDGFVTDNIIVGGSAAPSAVVPEPGTWALLGTGLLALGAVARRRRTAA
jgi:hypothetical protein